MKARNIDGFTRITKATARKLYNSGRRIYLLPVNIRFDLYGYWYRPYMARIDEHNAIGTNDGFNTIVPYEEFDKMVNCYEYYNCNSETGKYSAFYVYDRGEGKQ